MSFVFMVFHWPKPEQRDTLAQSMREMREALRNTAGCIDVDPPYLVDHEGECLVGISKWSRRKRSSPQALSFALPTRPSKERHDRGSAS
jgi:hypothetical protein